MVQLDYHAEVCASMPGVWITKSDEFYGDALSARGADLVQAATARGCEAVLQRRPLGGWALALRRGAAP